MALTSFKRTMRSWLPGAGQDTSGIPRQGKELVSGQAAFTTATAGLAVTPGELGLTNIDFVKFQIISVAGTAVGAVTARATYDVTNNLLFVVNVDYNGTNGDEVALSNNEAVIANVFALGDSSRDVELL